MLLPGHLDNKVTRYNKTVSHTDKTVSHTAHIRQVQVLILFLCPYLSIISTLCTYLHGMEVLHSYVKTTQL